MMTTKEGTAVPCRNRCHACGKSVPLHELQALDALLAACHGHHRGGDVTGEALDRLAVENTCMECFTGVAVP